METRNQLLSDHHHEQDLHYQPAFDNDLHGPAAARYYYAPRSLGVTTNRVVLQNNIGSFGTSRERINFEQCHSHEQYTGGGYHNAIASPYTTVRPPYNHSYAGPDFSDAFEQRPDFDNYYDRMDNDNIGQQSGDEQQPHNAGYTTPDSDEESDIPSRHLTGVTPDGEIPQKLNSIDEQVLNAEDEGDEEEGEEDEGDGDEDGDDEDETDDDEDEDDADDDSNDVEDSTQDGNPAPKRKQPATYLTSEVRKEMISKMSKYGKYKNLRKSGKQDYDQTCFHPDQKDWGEDRDDWPDILHVFNKPGQPEKRKRPSPIPNVVYKGMIVVAYRSKKPVRNFANIPMCISTEVEGWLLEAWSRQDPRIVHQDFCDRMPERGRPKPKDLSMRRSRFRWPSGLKSWVIRSATKEINAWLDVEVPKEYRDANSTRGWIGLCPEKAQMANEISKGKFPERARKTKRAQKEAEGSASGSSTHANDQSQTGQDQDNLVQSTESSRHTQTADATIVGSPQHTTKPAHARPKKIPKSRKTSGTNASTFSIPDTNSEGFHSASSLNLGAGQDQPHRFDYREQNPSTGPEKRAIQRALAPTRHQFQELLGTPTPPTDNNASYNQQWMALYQYYRSMAISAGTDEPQQLGQQEAWLFGLPQQFFLDTCELPETVGPQL